MFNHKNIIIILLMTICLLFMGSIIYTQNIVSFPTFTSGETLTPEKLNQLSNAAQLTHNFTQNLSTQVQQLSAKVDQVEQRPISKILTQENVEDLEILQGDVVHIQGQVVLSPSLADHHFRHGHNVTFIGGILVGDGKEGSQFEFGNYVLFENVTLKNINLESNFSTIHACRLENANIPNEINYTSSNIAVSNVKGSFRDSEVHNSSLQGKVYGGQVSTSSLTNIQLFQGVFASDSSILLRADSRIFQNFFKKTHLSVEEETSGMVTITGNQFKDRNTAFSSVLRLGMNGSKKSILVSDNVIEIQDDDLFLSMDGTSGNSKSSATITNNSIVKGKKFMEHFGQGKTVLQNNVLHNGVELGVVANQYVILGGNSKF